MILVDSSVWIDYFRAADSPQVALLDACLGNVPLAVRASEHYRWLRDRGITIRKIIDLLIATYCLENDMALLHAHRDFDPFVRHLGLKITHQAA